MSASELQLLIQMMDNLGRETRAGFERLDGKIDGMIPRPEFIMFQEAVSHRFEAHGAESDRRFEALEALTKTTGEEHDVIERKITTVDERVDEMNEELLRSRVERAEAFKTSTTKFWVAVGLAGLGALFSFLVALLSNNF